MGINVFSAIALNKKRILVISASGKRIFFVSIADDIIRASGRAFAASPTQRTAWELFAAIPDANTK